MPALIRYRHQVVFHWLVLMHLVLSGPKMLKGLSLATPSRIAERPFRRFHCARYWSVHFLLRWLAEETLKSTSRGQSGLCRLRWKQKEETGCEKTCSPVRRQRIAFTISSLSYSAGLPPLLGCGMCSRILSHSFVLRSLLQTFRVFVSDIVGVGFKRSKRTLHTNHAIRRVIDVAYAMAFPPKSTACSRTHVSITPMFFGPKRH